MLSQILKEKGNIPNFMFRFNGINNTIVFWIDQNSRLKLFGKNYGVNVLNEYLDKDLTQIDLINIINKLLDQKWEYVSSNNWVKSNIDILVNTMKYMTQTEARNWILNSTGQVQLNINLRRAYEKDEGLWKIWFRRDFPDFNVNEIPLWIPKTENNMWKRYYMWIHYFVINVMREATFILTQPEFEGTMTNVSLNIINIEKILLKTPYFEKELPAIDICKIFNVNHRWAILNEVRVIKGKYGSSFGTILRNIFYNSNITLPTELPKNEKGYLTINDKII